MLDVLCGVAKRGLPHAHILIWLTVKIMPNEIDKLISAKISNTLTNSELFKFVTKKYDTRNLWSNQYKFTMYDLCKLH